MPRRALADHRPYLLLSLLAGISYYFVADGAIGGLWLMLWKGAAVGFLALYAVRRGQGVNARLLAIVLAICALADMILEVSFLAGGALFAAAHLIAIGLYWRNRRPARTPSQSAAAVALVLMVPLIAGLLTFPLPNWELAAGYATIVGAMAAAAWISHFPRYRVGVGAVFFVLSDLLIFAREAGTGADAIADLLIWPLYFGGQFLIATGVIDAVRRSPA